MDRKINEIASKLRVKFKYAYISFEVEYNYYSSGNNYKRIRLYVSVHTFKDSSSNYTDYYQDINRLIEVVNSEFNLKVNKIKKNDTV